MIPEFTLDPAPGPEPQPAELSPEQEKRLEIMRSRRLDAPEHLRLEALLLERMEQQKPELEVMLKVMSDHWTYEDHFYRYYHSSWKVFRTQQTTEKAVALLRRLLPERELNLMFEDILKDGTGKDFDQTEHWQRDTRSIVEAFCHAKFMVEMAVRYADMPKPPQPMPSSWAALLYLCDLR